ncbi:hypothetical protein ACKWTF_009471 [Chironomus riparius]
MIENEKNYKTLKILDFKIVEFSSFFNTITLEPGGLIIGTLSILLFVSIIATLQSFGPFNDDYIVIMYYIILTIVCTFLIALVVGGFWMILVVYKKNRKMMKPLMIVQSIQPVMIYLFYVMFILQYVLEVYAKLLKLG